MNHQILKIILLAVATFIGSGGLAFVFGVEKKHIFWAVMSSVICCLSYEITLLYTQNIFIGALIASAITATYSDFMAHIRKVPATLMIILGIVPLVPGAKLYYTMLGAVSSDMNMFTSYGREALILAAGIALGIIAITAISRPVNAIINDRNFKKLMGKQK